MMSRIDRKKRVSLDKRILWSIMYIKNGRQNEKYQGWNFLFIDCKKVILDTKEGSFSGMKLPVCRLEGSN